MDAPGHDAAGPASTGKPAPLADTKTFVANAEDYNTNTYTSGPSSSFGSFKTTNEQMSLYATCRADEPG